MKRNQIIFLYSLIFIGSMAFLGSTDFFLRNFQQISRSINPVNRIGKGFIHPINSWILETHRSEKGGREWLYGVIPLLWKKPISSDVYYVFKVANNESIGFFEIKITNELDIGKINERCSDKSIHCTQIDLPKKFHGYLFENEKKCWLLIPDLNLSVYLSDKKNLSEVETAIHTE
jgi:hypothetical protein